MKKIKSKPLKKILIASSLSLFFVAPMAQARWCGNPVCPGDVVTDFMKVAKLESMQKAADQFVDQQLLPMLAKQMQQQTEFFGKKANSDFTRSVMTNGQKTGTETDLYNQSVLKDLKPIPEDACKMLTWQDYMDTKSSKDNEDKLMKAASSIARKNIDGKGMTKREKDLSLFEDIKNVEKTNNIVASPGDWMDKENIDKDIAKSAFVAIDTVTSTENKDDTKVSQQNPNSQLYQMQFVDSARKSLVYNYGRMMLSDPVYERIGVNNAKKSQIDESDINNPETPIQSNGESNYVDDIAKDLEKNKSNIKEDDQEISQKSPFDDFLSAPVRYTRISSKFSLGRKHPVLGIIRPHKGVDLAASTGTPIVAPADGNLLKVGVDSAGINAGFGNMIIINHSNGIQTWYGHLNGFAPGIATGGRVKKGDLIGYVGNTGHSTGSHLHYEIRVDGKPIDPMGRYGISESEATNNMIGDIAGVDNFNQQNGASMGQQMADGETLPPEFYRKLLISKAIALEKAWQKYKDIEKMKMTLSVKVLNDFNK